MIARLALQPTKQYLERIELKSPSPQFIFTDRYNLRSLYFNKKYRTYNAEEWTLRPLKMKRVGYLETSGTNLPEMQRHISEER